MKRPSQFWNEHCQNNNTIYWELPRFWDIYSKADKAWDNCIQNDINNSWGTAIKSVYRLITKGKVVTESNISMIDTNNEKIKL